jgi:hypothetical protein
VVVVSLLQLLVKVVGVVVPDDEGVVVERSRLQKDFAVLLILATVTKERHRDERCGVSAVFNLGSSYLVFRRLGLLLVTDILRGMWISQRGSTKTKRWSGSPF